MKLLTITLAAAVLAIGAASPVLAFEPAQQQAAVNYSERTDGATRPALRATPLPAERSAAYCQTPVGTCWFWGPPTWGVPCHCIWPGGTYYGYTNG
jgi:hypothetical protein